ncbi:MAG: hypothetical protein ABS939_00485 [Psychrobacillus sp.]
MFYSLEIYPDDPNEIATFLFTADYLTWLREVNDILTNLYSNESKNAKNLTQRIIINRIKIGGPALYQFEIKDNSFVTLCTEGITSEQFKEFIMRQSSYMQLKVKKNKVDDLSLFLDWCRYNDFELESYRNLINSFENNDYSFLLSKDDNGESNLRVGRIEKSSFYQVNKWIYPSEQRSFMEYRVYLLKDLLKTQIEKKLALVEYK